MIVRLNITTTFVNINIFNMIHIINEKGQKDVIANSNTLNEKVNRNVIIDIDWYKEHGYCSANDFF